MAVLALALVSGLLLLLLTLRERNRVETSLRESEERTRSILEAAQDAFVSMDATGVVTGWNRQAEATFGWSRTEAVGQTVAATIVPPELRDDHERGLRRFLETGERRLLDSRTEIEALHRDGRRFPVEVGVWAVRAGDGFSFNAFIRDISERKEAERELAAAYEQAMQASRLKSEFVANMSHEIRTPMNGVIGMTELLLGTDLTPEQRQYAETVRGSADALLTVINDILDFSKMEAGKLDLEEIEFDLRTAVEEVAELLARPAHEKGLELATLIHPDVPTIVSGDPGRLRQVLINLVGNAVKFTEKGEVVVRVSPAEETSDAVLVRLEVTDTGIGVKPADHGTLFEAFSQADASTTRRFGGTGLGLAISKQLVELMGGEIGVESEPGKGSRFWFTARLKKARESGPIATTTRATLAGLRVLVVDDNATNREILEQNLLLWGMRPASAESGPEALEMLREAADRGEAYALALLDFQMPGMDGLAVARATTDDPRISRTRLILLTSAARRGDARAARQAGIQGFLTKPVRQSVLYDTIVAVIELQGRESAAPLVTRHTVAEARAQSRAWILVAEDNPVNQKVTAGMLERLGHRVDVASNGVEAVQAASRTRYAAILMDVQMPELDGYEATMRIRAQEGAGRSIPIIALTAGAMKRDEEKALAAGMDTYITKPVKLEELASVLERWLPADPLEERRGAMTETTARNGAEAAGETLDAAVIAALRELDVSPGGDAARELVGVFLRDSDVRLEKLRRAVGEGDAQAIAGLCHSLKGSSAVLGGRRMADLCAALEWLASAGDLASAAQKLGELEAEFSRVRRALREEFLVGADQEPAADGSRGAQEASVGS